MELMATYHKRRQTKIVALGYEIFICIMLSLSMIQTGEFSQLSVCLSVSLSLSLSVCLSVCLSLCLSLSLFSYSFPWQLHFNICIMCLWISEYLY